MKRIGFVISVPLLVLCCLMIDLEPGLAVGKKNGKDVCFRWAFGAIVGPENDRRLVAITRDATLKSGDKLKMFVELQTKCFVYLFYRSGEGDIHLLFPSGFQQFARDYTVSEKYYIPCGDKWFELDKNVGRETFYLLASADRLISLEALFEAYQSAETSKKQETGRAILREIRKIRKQKRKLTAVAERPIPIGGNVRGTHDAQKGFFPDIDPIADEVATTEFYGRTFTIDHK